MGADLAGAVERLTAKLAGEPWVGSFGPVTTFDKDGNQLIEWVRAADLRLVLARLAATEREVAAWRAWNEARTDTHATYAQYELLARTALMGRLVDTEARHLLANLSPLREAPMTARSPRTGRAWLVVDPNGLPDTVHYLHRVAANDCAAWNRVRPPDSNAVLVPVAPSGAADPEEGVRPGYRLGPIGRRWRRGAAYAAVDMERFLRQVEVGDSCWLWQGARSGNRYGWRTLPRVVGEPRRMELAHRSAYRLFNGPIPVGKLVLHRCDNPQCVNPAHLYAGTQRENVGDAIRAGRHHSVVLRLRREAGGGA